MADDDRAGQPAFWRLGLAVAAVLTALDQASKWLVVDVVMTPPQVIEVTPFFNLVMAWNRGVSFGLFASNADLARWALIALGLVISGALLVWLRRADGRLQAAAIGLVIGGAAGNIVDRFRFGAVADFLDFHAFGYHWPAFNMADSAIFVGVGLLLFDALFLARQSNKT